MTAAVIAGAIAGAGIFLLIVALLPRRMSLARQLAAFDTRPVAAAPVRRFAGEKESEFTRRLGTGLAAFCKEQGWEFPGLRNDLALAGKSFENSLATSALLAVFGFLIGPILLLLLTVLGVHLSFVIPIWLGLVLAVVFSLLPVRRGQAEGRAAAEGFPARGRRLPRSGRDEPGRRPRRARGADGGQ